MTGADQGKEACFTAATGAYLSDGKKVRKEVAGLNCGKKV